MKLVVNTAKDSADREALSTGSFFSLLSSNIAVVLAQQRLIKMLEKQRNAEAEKVKLLQAEVHELRTAHEQVHY